MAHKTTEKDRMLADIMRKSGFENTAAYIEMFGENELNPYFWGKMTKEKDDFYKKCVEEKHPWDFYIDPPEEGTLL